MPTLELDEGFESGSLAAYGSAGSATIDATAALEGSLGLHQSGAGAQNITYQNTPASQTIAVHRFTFKVPTGGLPTGASAILLQIHTTSSKNAQIRINTAGNLQAIISSGAAVTFGAVTEGHEYTVDVRYDCSANPHKLDWSVDGTAQTQATSALAATAVSTSGGEKLGNVTSGVTAFECYYDSWAISRVSGDYPIGAPSSGGSTTDVEIDVTAGTTITTIKIGELVRTFSAGSTVTAKKQARLSRAISASSSLSIVKRITKSAFAVSAGSTVSLAASRLYMMALSATVGNSVSLVRQVGKKLTRTVSSTVTEKKAISRTLSFTGATTASEHKRVTKTVSASVSSTVSVVKQVGKVLTRTAAHVFTLDVQGPDPLVYTVDIVATAASTMTATYDYFAMREIALHVSDSPTLSVVKAVARTLAFTGSSIIRFLRGVYYRAPDPLNHIEVNTSRNTITLNGSENTISITTED